MALFSIQYKLISDHLLSNQMTIPKNNNNHYLHNTSLEWEWEMEWEMKWELEWELTLWKKSSSCYWEFLMVIYSLLMCLYINYRFCLLQPLLPLLPLRGMSVASHDTWKEKQMWNGMPMMSHTGWVLGHRLNTLQ